MTSLQSAVGFDEVLSFARASGGLVLGWSGHRPDRLGGYDERVRARITDLARAVLVREQPTVVVSGMALGVDQAAASAAVELGIPFVAMVPFEGQEGRWPAASQREFARLVGLAARVHVSVPRRAMEARGAAWALHERNGDMVRLVQGAGGRFAVVWNGQPGGTGGTVRRCEAAGLVVRNYWESWARFSGVAGG